VTTVQRDGLTFEVSCGGPPDGEPVLLLHGFPQTPSMWAAVAAGLHEHGYRTLALSQRGSTAGARPRSVRAYRLAETTADAAAVVDALAGGPVHVLGHDWGGPVAWMLAADHPHLVRTLTTISGPHLAAYLLSAVRSRQWMASWYIPVFQVPGLAERVLDPTTPAGLRRFVRLLSHFGHRPGDAEHDALALGRDGIVGGLAWYRALPFTDFRHLSQAKAAAPALLIWGDRDNAVLRKGIEMSQAYTTGPSRLEVLEGVSHWAPNQAPDRLVPLIAGHLATGRS
jgi:pimeloyl-ACP methyl ester carboxylesterase